VVKILDPQIVALGISLQSDLIFLKFSELNILKPILVVEGKLFKENTKKLKICIGLSLNFQVLLPTSILISIR